MTGKVAALFAPIIKAAKLASWPVGSIYMSLQATSPATLFGGTWERIANGRMLIGADSASYPAGSTGGEAKHALTETEMPSHNHGVQQAGSDGAIPMEMGKDGTYQNDEYLSFGTSVKPFAESTILISYRGGNQPHNNMPPYLSVYMWRRTA
ncbi:MAG: hypothetical protein HP053_00530 [Christensenellaceae bacterium]|nr:hypothetical protein [Christensenellaceae bacterium]